MVKTIEAVVDPFGRCNPANAAKVLQCSPATLANWRSAGEGPPFLKVGGRVFYRFADLESFAGGGSAAQAA